MAEKEKKFTPVANPELARAMQALRSSSAASPHEDRRTKRARTREASKRADIRNNGW